MKSPSFLKSPVICVAVAFFLLLVCCSFVFTSSSSSSTTSGNNNNINLHRSEHPAEDVQNIDVYPDPYTNDGDREQLSCSACLHSVEFMMKSLERVKKEFHLQKSKLKEYHVLDVLDDLCTKKTQQQQQQNTKTKEGKNMSPADSVGLVQVAGEKRLRTTYASEDDLSVVASRLGVKSVSLLKASHYSRFWEDKCSAMISRAEELIKPIFRGEKVTSEMMCPDCKIVFEKEKLKKSKNKSSSKKKNKESASSSSSIKKNSQNKIRDILHKTKEEKEDL